MNIAFLCREDFFRKFGGDTNQVLKYKKYWESDKNHRVDIITKQNFEINYDLFIVVNIDRFLETFYFLRKLKKANKLHKTSILCIHHNFDDVVFFEKNIKKGFSGLLASIGGYFLREKAKDLILSFKNRVFRVSALRELCSSQSFFLNSIKDDVLFVFLSEGERFSLEKDFNLKLKEENLIFTKNGCEMESALPVSNNEYEYDILVSGRIEPRKNQIRIINDLCTTNYKICFVGGANENNAIYFDKFMELINRFPNMIYLGKVSPEEMTRLYYKSKIHISASWFEVSSLVDLEAYYCGCSVISSKNGYTSELLGERVFYFDPKENENLSAVVGDAMKAIPVKDYKEFIAMHHDWEINSLKLLRDLEYKIEVRNV
ncbi:glycosyltransferase [Klebsiella pneumoniae]